MKKTIYAFLCAIICAATLPTLASAEQYLPKSISIGTAFGYNAGDIVKVDIAEGSRSVGLQTNIEYGVARTIENDGLTYFEIVTTEYVDISKLSVKPNLSVLIPNTLPENATNTYVVYTKYFEKNAQDNESFYFTKEFTIVPNDTPFVKVKHINFLQSNGSRYATLHGPTIYTQENASKDALLATSSSLEITFESNTDTTIVPNISFTKLRSGAFKKDISLPPITIKKGKTYTTISLPTFDYEPGVYTGQLTFTSTLLKNKVDFQYIVAGDSVSIGTINPITKDGIDAFTIEIFGRPLDLDRFPELINASSSEKDMYKVKVDFLDAAGNTIYTNTQDVDFALSEFTAPIPKGTGKIAKVGVTVSSITSGKVVFETVRDVLYEGQVKAPIKPITYAYFAIYILLMIIGVLAIAGRHAKTAIFCIVLLAGLFLVHSAFAAFTSLEPYRASPAGSRSVRLQIQDDAIQNTYTCGETIPFVFRLYYVFCSNATTNMKVGFSWLAPIAANQTVTNGTGGTYVGKLPNGHNLYAVYSGYFTPSNLTAPSKGLNSLYISVLQRQVELGNGAVGTNDSTTYTIPVKTTCTPESTVCSCSGRNQICYQNGVVVSTTTNATSCALKALCGYTISANRATFTTIVLNAIGTVSYRDNATGRATTNVVTKNLSTSTSTPTTHNVTVTDASDGTTSIAICSTDSAAQELSEITDRGGAAINSFKADKPVVEKNKTCDYRWNVENVDQCSLVVNNTSVLLQGAGLVGPISVSTADGLNQRATITCTAEAFGGTPTVPARAAVTISTTTLCQVLPEVVER